MSLRSITLVALALPLFHCGTAPVDADFSSDDGADVMVAALADELPVSQAAPPIDLGWYVPPMVFGETTEVLVTGGEPNKPVVFVASPNLGAPEACPAALAPDCLGIPGPFSLLATERFNANGEATFTLRVPASLPFNEVAIQAASISAGQVYLAPALTKPIWDAPMDAEINDVRSGLVPTTSIVRTQGIVTAQSAGGYFLQQPGQADFAGIYVFDGFSSFKPEVGDEVSVIGTYEEYSSGTAADSLAEIVTPGSTYTVFSSGNALPAPVAITPAAWDDANLLEAHESMRLVVEPAAGLLTVTTDLGFGEFGLSDGGTTEAVIDNLIFDYIVDIPTFGISDTLTEVSGTLYYSFGNYKMVLSSDTDLAGWTDNTPAP